MTGLPSLLARVEAATGPDPALDGALDVLTGYEGEAWPARYTASVDACLALAERVLPGCHWAAGTVPETGWQDALPGDFYASVGSSWAARFYGAGKTPALALCVAILKAKLASIRQELKE